MDKSVQVYIEIEQHSNIKYEFDKEKNSLVVDRILPYPYYYPYAYGYIRNTIASDNDELDALIITNTKILNDCDYDAYIIGVLIMEDEKGLDEKVICVLKEDYDTYYDIDTLSNEIKENIHWFFSNYKSKTPNKWSKVYGYKNKEDAIKLYKKYCV